MSPRPTLKLIAGLGNPGERYSATRHNAGFWFIDRLARRAGVALTQQNKFHGEVAKARLGAHEVWLLKPQTFMNESGNALRALAAFYKIEANEILVAHDEVDLPAGTVRLKHGGGHGGNNGLRSICAHLGHDFTRLRIGVGRPPKGGDMTAHVLGRPGAAEQRVLDDALIEAERACDILLSEGRERAMTWLHSTTSAADSAPRPGGGGGKSRKSAGAGSQKQPAGSAAPATQAAGAPRRADDAAAGPANDGEQAQPAGTSDATATGTPDGEAKAGSAEPERATSLRDQLRGLFRRGDNH